MGCAQEYRRLRGTRVTLLTSNADLIEQLIQPVNHPETAVMYWTSICGVAPKALSPSGSFEPAPGGRPMMRLRNVAVAVLSMSALMLTACASTSVNRILADPSRYRDQEVRVSGSVVDSYSVANRGAYRIGDETGQLWVVSDRGAPRKGAHVTVKGTIREGFNFGGLGDRINLPAGLSGLVMVETSHKAGK